MDVNVEGSIGGEKNDRIFFVIDVSKLKKEDDQLVNAKLVFRPEEKYQKNEQLCSQLIGLSVCTMNLTGQYPQYLKLRGPGYAIKALGEDCVMGLSTTSPSRSNEEPSSSVVQTLKLIHDLFVFFYHSPDMVKKQAGEKNWSAICTSMCSIFTNILAYVEHEYKSIASMLNPLPYGKYNLQQSVEARVFLMSSRLLKHCQQMQPLINVGCIFHRNKIFCSLLPTGLTEKLLLLVHTKTRDTCMEQNLRSLFAEEISGHVWMVPVYLLLAEEEELKAYKRDRCGQDSVYNTLQSTSSANLFSAGASFFARFTAANPPRASKKSASGQGKVQGSPLPMQKTTKRPTVRSAVDVDRTYEDVTDAVEQLKLQNKLQASKETAVQSSSESVPSLPPRAKASSGVTTPSAKPPRNGLPQPDATSTPDRQPRQQKGNQRLTSPPLPSYNTLTPGNPAIAKTPQSGGRGPNTTLYFSPNESFPVEDTDVARVPLQTTVAAVPAQTSVDDDDFMESSTLENLIRSRTMSKDRAPSNAPPPLPPRTGGDYANMDTLLASSTNDKRPPADSKPPAGDSQEDLSEDVPPPIPPRRMSDSELVMVPPPEASVNTTSISGGDGGGSAGSDGGNVTSLAAAPDRSEPRDGIDLTKPKDGPESNDLTAEPDNSVISLGSHTVKMTQQGSLEDVPVPDDSAMLRDGPQGDSFSLLQRGQSASIEQEECLIPVPSNSASSNADLQSDLSIQQQASLDVEDRRTGTGAEDGEYCSPLPSDDEEDEYVPSWANDNREWGLAERTSLKGGGEAKVKEEKARLKREEAGLNEEEIKPKEEQNVVGASNEYTGAVAAEEDVNFEEEEVIEGEGEDEKGMSSDHKSPPHIAHVMRPVAMGGEGGCGVHLVRKYLFLQNYMNTTVVLLADEGLQNEQDQLRELFTTLLVHQSAIEDTLTQHSEVVMEDSMPVTRTMYRSIDRKCEMVGTIPPSQFRHALRRAHQEYQNDASLLQISMSKDGRTTLSRCVLGREVYVHCKRNQKEDALQTLPTVENIIRGGNRGAKDEDGSEPHGLFL